MSSLACAVCSAAKDDASNFAFLVMTAFMTLLPLTVLGGLIYLVVRRVRALESDDVQARSHARSHAPGPRASEPVDRLPVRAR